MTAGWAEARRVLCVRLDALGDILMTTPAIRAIAESAPGRHITLLTSPSGAAIASLVPEIDDVIVYEAPWMKATASLTDSRNEQAMIERLRSGRFDAAVIFTVYSQNPLPAALLCFLGDIPLRLAHCRENPYQLLTDWVPEPEPGTFVRHEVQRQLDLVKAVGCSTTDPRMSLLVEPTALRRVRRTLQRAGIDPGGRFVVIHPGASAPSRRYPASLFAEAARLLALQLDCQLVLTGSRGEAGLVEEIRSSIGVPAVSLAGRLTLPELVALVDLAPLLVSNNTGPVHIASAVGTPVVDLYALTNPQHTPWLVPSRVLFHDVPCRYCYKSVCPAGHHDCLTRVQPAAVAEAARQLLEGDERTATAALPPLYVPLLPAAPLPGLARGVRLEPDATYGDSDGRPPYQDVPGGGA